NSSYLYCMFSIYVIIWIDYSATAIISVSFTTKYSVPSYFTSVPEYFSKRTLSPTLTSIGERSPLSSIFPSPTATTVANCGFSFAESGNTIPLGVVVSSSTSSSNTRFPNGFNISFSLQNIMFHFKISTRYLYVLITSNSIEKNLKFCKSHLLQIHRIKCENNLTFLIKVCKTNLVFKDINVLCYYR